MQASNVVEMQPRRHQKAAEQRKRRGPKVHATTGAIVAEPSTEGVLATETKQGEKRWLVNIRLKGHPAVSRQFATSHTEARDWRIAEVARIKAAIKSGHVGSAVVVGSGSVPQAMLMPEVLQHYVERSLAHGLELSKRIIANVERMKKHPLLVALKVKDVNVDTIRDFCSHRKNVEGAHASTVNQDYVRINQAVKRCASWLKWGKFNPLDKDVRKELTTDGLIAQSAKRSRRPNADEQAALVAHFKAHQAAMAKSLPQRIAKVKAEGGRVERVIPMADLIDFAMLSAFRRGEITSLLWSDLKKASIVCWRKDSKGEKSGPHKGKRYCLVPVGAKAMAIIERQPRTDNRIFPYVDTSVGKAFSTACKKLKIRDLRFHDLRHEAISRIAATEGMSHSRAMSVSGHKTTAAFLGYVHGSEEEAAETAAMLA